MAFPLKLQRPLIVFDLETTGLDFKYDRVIEIGAVKLHPDGRREAFHKRINPGMRIPKEVSQLTGITNEDVAGCDTFSGAINEISSFFDGADIAGYNVIRFDAKVINEEFRRAGMDFKLSEKKIVDAKVIYHQKERRDLSAAFLFYCNQELKDAHSAQADTEATADILLAQLEKYADLPRDVQGLDDFCKSDRDRFVDQEGKFFWRDGEAVFNFGKYKSKSLKEVVKIAPDYLNWVISPERQFSQEIVDICYNALNGEFPKKAGG